MNVLVMAAIAGLGALLLVVNASTASAASDNAPEVSGDNMTSANDTSAPAPAENDWTKYDDLFHQEGDNNGVDWTWLKAFALNESNLGRAPSVARGISSPSDVEGSKSSDGKSWGLMQTTIPTAQGIDPAATPEKLNDPSYSISIGAQYIAQLQSMFSSVDPRYAEWVVKSYNQGPGNTKKEIAGTGGGYADAYWDRWQKNLTQVEENI